MKFMITKGLDGIYGSRLWVRKVLDSEGAMSDEFWELVNQINPLSCWGGHDRRGATFLSWEFSWLPGHENDLLEAKKLLVNAGFIEEEFDLWPEV